MGRMPRATYLWPGLPQVCDRGSWAALGLAVGFTLLLNLVLVGTLLWSDFLPVGARTLMWALTGLVWVGSAVYSRFWDGGHAGPGPSDRPGDAYPEAQELYLKGNWFEAERILAKLLKRNPRDLESRLMLATLLRHTGRRDEAARQLDRLERFEGSSKWVLEISRERQRLHAAEADDGDPDEATATAAAAAESSPQAA